MAIQTKQKVMAPAEFGKVAVLMGGTAAERDISLKSGAAVLAALQAQEIDAHGLDAKENILPLLQQGDFDRVFIVLHGRKGEDGVMQGALETIDLPYTGSDVLGSALGMDKLRCKQIWQGVGMPTAGFAVVNNESDFDAVTEQLGLPVIVKPAREGSSIGMAKVMASAQLVEAVQIATALDDSVIAEQWITGAEYTVAILDGEALPAIRLETPNDFYDYEAKYQTDTTQYHCPCGLSAEKEAELQKLAVEAFALVGASGWGRVDFMADELGRFYLLEVNTVPGMTSHSLVPMAAKAAGLSFNNLVWRILETSVDACKEGGC
ncbi:D-alanine--D-alanine ligase [Pseudomonadota bacterium]